MEIEKCKEKVEIRQIPDEIKTLNAIADLLEMKQGNYDRTLELFAKSNTKFSIYIFTDEKTKKYFSEL